MGIEFTICKEMATISVTAEELATADAFIREEITSGDFLAEYDSLLSDIVDSYRVVLSILRPMTELDSFASFAANFTNLRESYSNSYQPALSKPRINAEFTFQKYLQFRKRKETQTNYQVLKNAFSRLHDFIDKWIDNDIWLAMTIDSLLKMLFRFLTLIADSKDSEAACNEYLALMRNLRPYLDIVEQQVLLMSGKLTVDASGVSSSAD